MRRPPVPNSIVAAALPCLEGPLLAWLQPLRTIAPRLVAKVQRCLSCRPRMIRLPPSLRLREAKDPRQNRVLQDPAHPMSLIRSKS